METLELEILEARAEGSTRPPLLFVHGAWHGAWCWAERFLPYMAAHGYDAYAVSLRGHGRSGSAGPLRRASLRDYAADVARAAAGLPRPPVLVGHSMGALLALRHVAAGGPAAAAVLVAPVPVSGVLRLTLRAARRHPLAFLEVNATLRLWPMVKTPALAREFLLRAGTDDAEARRVHARLQDESYLAYLGMLAPRVDARRIRVPTLVLAAGADRLFTTGEVQATADALGADLDTIPEAAHDVMLDPGWERAAARIVEWVGARAP